MSKLHFIKGFIKNLFNHRIALLSFISSNTKIDKTAYIYRGVKAKSAIIGAHTYISVGTDIENAEIGNYCSIADHCRIGMSGHSLDYLSTSPIFTQTINALHERWVERDVFEHKSVEERVYIGNDVWVGSHVLVKGGVRIGDGACIAAGAVVVKDVPPYAIVGGVPANVIRFRFDERTIRELLDLKWWNMDDAILKGNIILFQNRNINIGLLKGALS